MNEDLEESKREAAAEYAKQKTEGGRWPKEPSVQKPGEKGEAWEGLGTWVQLPREAWLVCPPAFPWLPRFALFVWTWLATSSPANPSGSLGRHTGTSLCHQAYRGLKVGRSSPTWGLLVAPRGS